MNDDHMLGAGEDMAASLRKVLNTHGYGFHYAVLDRTRHLSDSGRSSWLMEAAELPVRTGNFDTRVDFVLRRRVQFSTFDTPLYLVGECKRANPATANWCFVRAPYVARDWSDSSVITDMMVFNPATGVASRGERFTSSLDLYHLGLELRSNEKGDSGGPGRTQIEDAAAQVLKGVNGLINFFGDRLHLIPANTPVRFIPVIFTTARLWTSDVALSAADLSSGTLSPEQVSAKPANWVWYQYNLSPSLRHSLLMHGNATSISEFLQAEFARGIAVVSASGVDEFLSRDW